MSRNFGYARISTPEQVSDNQKLEIEAAGFKIEPQRFIAEVVSGSVAATSRDGFRKLVDKMEAGDILVVSKLDRLGRNAMDVRQTVEMLAARNIKVHCLALGGVDLTSPAGKMTMGVIAAVAEFERDLLVERTQSGLKRAKAEGKTLGRPPSLTDRQKRELAARLMDGESVSSLARSFEIDRATVYRLKRAALPTAEMA